MKQLATILLSCTHNILLKYMSNFNKQFSEWITAWFVNMFIYINILTIIHVTIIDVTISDSMAYFIFFIISIFIYIIYLKDKNYVNVNLKYEKAKITSIEILSTIAYYVISIYFFW